MIAHLYYASGDVCVNAIFVSVFISSRLIKYVKFDFIRIFIHANVSCLVVNYITFLNELSH